MLWLAWRERSKLLEPPVEPPRVIEVALIAAQRQAAPELPKASPPAPPVQKPEPKPDKPLPKKAEKPKPKPKPTPKPLPDKAPEPRPELPEKTDPAPSPAVTAAAPPAQGNPLAASSPTPSAQGKPGTSSSSTPSLVEPKFQGPGLRNPPTRYPRLALERQWEGRVLLRVQVHADGSPGDIRVEQSSGHELLDEAAVTQVGQWRFLPARRGDQTVASSVIVPIEFKLKR
jgi:protein TonB